MAILASGSVVVSAVNLAFTPIVTRLYDPEFFGALGVFMSILAIVTPIAALSYPLAIVLPKNDGDASALARLSLTLAAVATFLGFIVLYCFWEPIALIVDFGTASSFILLVPLATFFNVYLMVMEQWAIRKSLFRIKALAAVAHALLLGSSRVAAGFFSPSALALIVLTALGIFVHTLTLVVSARLHKISPGTGRAGIVSLRAAASKHFDFPAYRMPEQVMTAMSYGMPVLILAALFDQASAGFYALAVSTLGVPTVLIGTSIHNVFYPRLNVAVHESAPTQPLIWKTTVGLFLAGGLPYLILVLFGPSLFGIIFGDTWESSGHYARWLAPLYFSMLLNKAAVAAIPVLGAQRFFLFYSTMAIMVRMASLSMGYFLFADDDVSIALFSISGIILNIYLILSVMKISKNHDTHQTTG